MDNLRLRGHFNLVVTSKSGDIRKYDITNTITTEGKNSLLDTMFNSGTQITSWYIGLISNGSYSAVAAADTMASHAGWVEFTSYDETTRQAWSPDAAASGSNTNSTAAVFTINATGVIKGLFIVSNSTISGTTGTLWAAAIRETTISVADGDTLNVTYGVDA